MSVKWDEPSKEPLAEQLREHMADVVRRMYDDIRGHTGRDHSLIERQLDTYGERLVSLEHDRDILVRRLSALEQELVRRAGRRTGPPS